MMQSNGGMADEAFVEIPDVIARIAEEKRMREEIVKSIPPCPACGEPRVPMKNWDGVDAKPWIKCENENCSLPRPRKFRPQEW